jgi:Putative conjugal transfer nickase/helicase TraI C-term/Putative helicase
VLGEIISLADRQSVGHNLGAGTSPKAAKSQVVPLHEKLVMALRQLVDENTLPLNRNGAAGWRTGNKLWLVSKRAVDSMRLYLNQSGHSGIPTENQRLFDVLQEHQILEPNQDRAIWRMTVQGDNWSHDFTLLCIPLIKIWPNPDAWPEEFTVTAQLNDSEATNTEKTYAFEDEDELISVDQLNNLANSTQSNEDSNAAAPKADGKPNTKKEKPSVKANSGSPKPDASTKNTADEFLPWVVAGLADRSLDNNNPGARIHVVNEGVLLVSPGIFKDFVKHTKESDSWETVQKKFLKLALHERTEGGLNVHKYRVSGNNNSATIMALVLKDVGLLFKTS